MKKQTNKQRLVLYKESKATATTHVYVISEGQSAEWLHLRGYSIAPMILREWERERQRENSTRSRQW